MGKALANGFIRDRGNPKPLHRFMAAGFCQNPAGHQFAFPARIGGNNHIGNIFSVQMIFYCLILFARLLNNHQLEFFREHRQIFHLPGFIFRIVGFRVRQRHKVPQSPGDDILISLQSALIIFTAF